MKHNFLKPGILLLGMGLLLINVGVYAQPRLGFRLDSSFLHSRGMYAHDELNLTEDQSDAIQELRSVHQKEVADIQNELAIKRAELQKLRSAEDPDIEEILSVLDEIGSLTTDISKKKVTLEHDIGNLLTDEQKVAYQMRQFSRSRSPMGRRLDWRNERGSRDMFPGRPLRNNMRRNQRF